MRRFAGLELGEDRIPDETTILNFRHLPERHALTEAIFAEVNAYLAENGLTLRSGTLVDATIIDAPSSTKNKAGKRDPEMSSTKKGNYWYFGMKAHVGVDADSGLVHSLETTTAKVHDSCIWDDLLHGGETSVWADKAYVSADRAEAFAGPGKFWGVMRKAPRGGELHADDDYIMRPKPGSHLFGQPQPVHRIGPRFQPFRDRRFIIAAIAADARPHLFNERVQNRDPYPEPLCRVSPPPFIFGLGQLRERRDFVRRVGFHRLRQRLDAIAGCGGNCAVHRDNLFPEVRHTVPSRFTLAAKTSAQSRPSGAGNRLTFQPSAEARAARWFPAFRPASSPSVAIISRCGPSGRRSAFIPLVDKAAQMVAEPLRSPLSSARPVSMPSHTTSGPGPSDSRTAPSAHGPSIIFAHVAIRFPDLSKNVRCTPPVGATFGNMAQSHEAVGAWKMLGANRRLAGRSQVIPRSRR